MGVIVELTLQSPNFFVDYIYLATYLFQVENEIHKRALWGEGKHANICRNEIINQNLKNDRENKENH